MQAQYVALLQAQPVNPAAIARQLAVARADEENGNCNRFLFFGPAKSPACPSIQASIAQLERQLGTAPGGSLFASSPDEQKMSLQASLQENGCSIPSLSTGGRTLCVRTCDGYYFPLSNRVSSRQVKADAATCQAMYGAPTLASVYVERGDDVAGARTLDGKRYGDQSFAFLYRSAFDASCHAQLKKGLATLEAKVLAGEVTPVAQTASVPASGEAAWDVETSAAEATSIAEAASAELPHAALQAISAVQPAAGKHSVRFVGDAYYRKVFAYTGE